MAAVTTEEQRLKQDSSYVLRQNRQNPLTQGSKLAIKIFHNEQEA